MAVKAGFIAPMLLLRTETLPNDPHRWAYELKLDGYRAIGFKTKGQLYLRSRNDNDFSLRYPAVVGGLAGLPDDTVIDGEIVAFDEEGRPSFNVLQNYGSSPMPVVFYVFDVMVLRGKDLTSETLERRQALLQRLVLPKLKEPVRYAGTLNAALPDLIASVKAQGLEGLVAKRLGSRYEPGMRSGAWMKMRVNRGQEFVIGGYTLGTKTFDAIVFGYYEGKKLMYVARTRNGFTSATRLALFKRFAGAGDPGVPICEFAGGKKWQVGAGAHKGKDGGMPLAQADACRSDRVPRMDQRQSPPALTIRRSSRRQAGEGRKAGTSGQRLGRQLGELASLMPANKKNLLRSHLAMAAQTCSVTFIDPRGVRHTVDVLAESLFEAAVLGLAALKKDGWTEPIGAAAKLEVEVRSPAVKHVVSVIQIQRWLQGATTSPNERVIKDRLSRLLSAR